MPKCPYCQKVEAKWVYMPNGEYACDDCVPRKCSCNMEQKELEQDLVQKYHVLIRRKLLNI